MIIPCLFILAHKKQSIIHLSENNELSTMCAQKFTADIDSLLHVSDQNSGKAITNASLRYTNTGTAEVEIVVDEPIMTIGTRWVVTKNGNIHSLDTYQLIKSLPHIDCKNNATPTSRFVEWLMLIPTTILDTYTLTYSNDFCIELHKKNAPHYTILCSCTMPFNDQTIFNCSKIEKQLAANTLPQTHVLQADVRFENQIIIKKLTKGGHHG